MTDPKAMEAARRIMERAERIESNKRPTVAELEAILAQADSPPVHINPDGSIGAGENDALTVARALLAGEGNSVAAGAGPFGLLPCPFCGDTAQDGSFPPTIECTNCGAETGHYKTAADAAKAWNLRAGKDTSGEKAGITQASDSLARPAASPSMRENFTLAGYLEGHLIARTLFASRAVAFSPQPHWDQDPNPLRGECLDDAWDIVRALGARGMLSSPSPAVRDVTLREALEAIAEVRFCEDDKAALAEIFRIAGAALSPLSPPEGGKP